MHSMGESPSIPGAVPAFQRKAKAWVFRATMPGGGGTRGDEKPQARLGKFAAKSAWGAAPVPVSAKVTAPVAGATRSTDPMDTATNVEKRAQAPENAAALAPLRNKNPSGPPNILAGTVVQELLIPDC